jgi:hypothetical protein
LFRVCFPRSSDKSSTAFICSKNGFCGGLHRRRTPRCLVHLPIWPEARLNCWRKMRCSRQQLIILRRQVKRPVCTKMDRFLLVFLAGMTRTWKHALFLVQPDTLLRWHHELYRLFWKHQSKSQTRKPWLSLETIRLIKDMAANNRRWGAERIRGELLKLQIHVGKRTIQKYMKQNRAISSPWTELEDLSPHSCGRGMDL